MERRLGPEPPLIRDPKELLLVRFEEEFLRDCPILDRKPERAVRMDAIALVFDSVRSDPGYAASRRDPVDPVSDC